MYEVEKIFIYVRFWERNICYVLLFDIYSYKCILGYLYGMFLFMKILYVYYLIFYNFIYDI